MRYLESISYTSNNDERFETRGFVYDGETCSLMTAVRGEITQSTTFEWVAPGSLALIRDYFNAYEREWHECLELACAGLGVTVRRFSTLDQDQCILGAGAFGRVFKVLRGEQLLTLKLVPDEDCCKGLVEEFELIRNLPVEVEGRIVGVEADSLWRGSLARQGKDPLTVAAFLMNTIGIPFLHLDKVTDEYGPLSEIISRRCSLQECGAD